MNGYKSTLLLLLSGIFIFTLLSILLLIIRKTPPEVIQEIQQTTSPTSTYNPQLPTIGSIFSDNHEWVATLPAQHLRTIIATGDVIPARSVNFKAISYKDFTWAFQKTADVIKNADITFINLETPLLNSCQTTQEGMIFCGASQHIEGLTFSGVDVVSLANNHAGNYQKSGVDQTIALLKNAGIEPFGTTESNLVIKNIRGTRFAFLGFNDIEKLDNGVSNADFETIAEQIQQAKKASDVVIVTYHWGAEYQAQPDARQIELGHYTIESGADLVIGNHPHWIQPVEVYKGKLITYAHGNFVFDQMWSEETKKGVVGRYTFYDDQLIDIEYLPVYIENYGQPHFLDNEEKQAIISDMYEQSKVLQQNKLID